MVKKNLFDALNSSSPRNVEQRGNKQFLSYICIYSSNEKIIDSVEPVLRLKPVKGRETVRIISS